MARIAPPCLDRADVTTAFPEVHAPGRGPSMFFDGSLIFLKPSHEGGLENRFKPVYALTYVKPGIVYIDHHGDG